MVARLGEQPLDWERLLGRPVIRFAPEVLRPAVAGRRVLVTGAGGSLGRALVRWLVAAEPAALVLLDHHEPSLFQLRQAVGAVPVPCRFVLADVRDRVRLERLLTRERIAVVFHLAAYKHVTSGEENPEAVVEVNVLGTLRLLEAAALAGVERFVYPSTDKAVRPPSLYGATKRLVELVLRARAQAGLGPPAVAVRLVNVLGSQGSVIEIFLQQIMAGQPLSLTDPAMRRYWITEDEAVGLLLVAAWLRESGPLVLDLGEPVPLVEIARRLWRALGREGEPPLRVVGPRPGERLVEELTYPDERLRPTAVPGVRAVVAASSPPAGLLAALAALERDLMDLAPADLRRRLFALLPTEVTV